ncbi:small acid-soluble spore protein H [Siminovitchia sp. FSL H7-0308]|jgi:small acid-soluble spore protein H (minor)|uniref:Small, acid-soluble spore protein H n=1 Tax=Siminovitchia thermophila TaxID=1245522 RepID=A0ABS2RCX9_9BACI|nr:small acid-soluble spore protein H [Siminovitchia thermophila]MBM7717518.1 small acid-soluble spore protein H (minor) [Siminovitchia thermophila]ONK22861.1 H-type small acid-soluble spore protein [Bacillus sp. VT-16-64]
MNIMRAKEIASLPDMVKVTLNGVPVYIQHVDEKNETARIYPLDEPQNEQSVSIRQLKEEEG